jgi:hypothetical protein
MAADGTQNWRLILEAARALTAAGQAPFTRISVYEWICRRYPRSSHDRPSLDPTFQGMVRGATGGPKSLAGTPLVKTGHGRYVLAETVGEADVIRAAPPPPAGTPTRRIGASPLGEDQVKQGAKEFLERAGFRVTVAWGHERGVDITAVSGTEILLFEAKGSAQNPPQQVNYFLGALGELLQRMTDPRAGYGLALPDNPQYRGLVSRLPPLVWERLKFTALFVSKPSITPMPSSGSPGAHSGSVGSATPVGWDVSRHSLPEPSLDALPSIEYHGVLLVRSETLWIGSFRRITWFTMRSPRIRQIGGTPLTTVVRSLLVIGCGSRLQGVAAPAFTTSQRS